jgi:hypothetical protein
MSPGICAGDARAKTGVNHRAKRLETELIAKPHQGRARCDAWYGFRPDLSDWLSLRRSGLWQCREKRSDSYVGTFEV